MARRKVGVARATPNGISVQRSGSGSTSRSRDRGVDAPWPRAGEDEIEEDEAEQYRTHAVVHRREEGLRVVELEVGDSHLAGEDECDRAREEAEQQQQAADRFEPA